ncbi:MAG TPA: ABC transporter permease [Acholeplasmataceae bacterium]|jgi:NitT/TauT family transport system permease protein|nr:ABC transporter permease [Acholeplasmataceae bacterium]
MSHKLARRRARIKLILAQILFFIAIIAIWEAATRFRVIDEFLFSKPSAIAELLWKYTKSKEIFTHIYISLLETVLGVIIGSVAGVLIAVLLWSSRTLTKLLEPFLVILNALPKTALAPIMIIWAGTGVTGIVVVAISILLIITILSTYNYFMNVDPEKVQMMRSFNANKYQIFTKLVFPANLVNIISVVKINIGMAWVGVIVGEFLVSRRGIGNLIMYGGQIFRFDMVMMGVIVLSMFAYLMYEIVNIIEKILIKKRGKGI